MIERAVQILTENQSDAEDTKTRIHTPPYFEGVVTTPNYCRCVSASNSGVRTPSRNICSITLSFFMFTLLQSISAHVHAA